MTTDTPPNDTTTTPPTTRTTDRLLCPVCWTPFPHVPRRRFCSDSCRKTAWARTHQPLPQPPGSTHPRRHLEIYACPTCHRRYHGHPECSDCNQTCTRVGFGGLCPHCDQAVAFTELLNTPTRPTPNTPNMR